MPETRITREDVAATIEARRELGAEMEPAVVDAFVDKVERAIEKRAGDGKTRRPRSSEQEGMDFALAIVSLGTGIPITAIAGDAAGIQGIIAAWAGIVGVNLVRRLRR
jgi:hypothetical protein